MLVEKHIPVVVIRKGVPLRRPGWFTLIGVFVVFFISRGHCWQVRKIKVHLGAVSVS